MDAPKIKPYKKEFDYSYAFGAFAVYEMVSRRPDAVAAVYVHSQYADKAGIENLCQSKRIPAIYDDKKFSVAQKENCFVFGVFSKYVTNLSPNAPHIVLVNPGDMGNLGTIIRTQAGFGFYDLAIINPAADIFNPKTVRASMGALFGINYKCFNSFSEYEVQFKSHRIFPFMTGGKTVLTFESCPRTELFSLVFGNESSGLPESRFGSYESVSLLQTPSVDSLNLSVAAGIGMYIFACENNLHKNKR